eukprot:355955-Rhodomonas_salina.1
MVSVAVQVQLLEVRGIPLRHSSEYSRLRLIQLAREPEGTSWPFNEVLSHTIYQAPGVPDSRPSQWQWHNRPGPGKWPGHAPHPGPSVLDSVRYVHVHVPLELPGYHWCYPNLSSLQVRGSHGQPESKSRPLGEGRRGHGAPEGGPPRYKAEQ